MKKTMIFVLFLTVVSGFSATVGERNNNPGNVKKPGSDTWLGTIGTDRFGHVVFKDLDHGIRALYRNFKTRQLRSPELSLGDYFSKVYAEENGIHEAKYIASKQGISVNTPLRDVNLIKMVVAVSWFESNMVITEEQVLQVVKRFNL
jgi:hypothetical protein